jgi:hypothetical protein
LKNEERLAESRLSRAQQWLAASALIPVIGALSRPTHLQALVYTFFVFLYLSPLVFEEEPDQEKGKDGEWRRIEHVDLNEDVQPPASQPLDRSRFFVATIAGGMVSVTLLWLSFLNRFQDHLVPYYGQLTADLFLAFFKYAALASSWFILAKQSAFTTNQIFLIMVAASLGEHALAGDFSPLAQTAQTDPLLAIFTVASWYVVDGSIVAMAFICGGRQLHLAKRRATWPFCLKAGAIVFILPLLCRCAAFHLAKLSGLCGGS